MAENVNITPGTGDVVAADDIAGVKHQRVKISQGVDGSATDVSSTDPLNVTLANTGANTTAIKTDGSAVTQPVSASSLPLPTGAATAAKQPALGTAGTASSDVITVQGITSMTALKVDGSATTQPVSGTVTANAGTGSFTVTQSTASNLKATDAATSATGSAVPASASYVGLVNTSGNLVGLSAGGNFSDASTLSAQLANGTYIYNGTNWDRARGTATDGAQVYVKGTATDNGLTASKVIAAATTNATSVKASAGKIYRIDAFNSDTVGYWVKLYNKASAPTVGTDVPVATKFVPAGGGFVIESTIGIPYTTGIALATTLNATDADTTAVTTANKLVINLRYV